MPQYFIGHSELVDGREKTVEYLWDPIDAESEVDAIEKHIISMKPDYASLPFDEMVENWHQHKGNMIYAIEVDPDDHRAVGKPSY